MNTIIEPRLINLNSEMILRLWEVTVTGGITFIISDRSGRDRHFDSRTAVIHNGSYFLKVTVTRCGLIKVMGMTRVTVTAVVFQAPC